MRHHPITSATLVVLTLFVGIPLSPVRDVVVCDVRAAETPASVDSLDVWLDWLAAGDDDAALLDLLGDDPVPASFAWSGNLATGYDAYVQTYSLALEDTTESVEEFEVTLSAEGATQGDADHRWRVAPRLSVGSERTRQQLDLGWIWQPDDGPRRLDAVGEFRATQYHGTTDYSLSSDFSEGRGRLRWHLSPAGRLGGEARVESRVLRYADPSELQVNRNDVEAVAALVSGRDASDRWRLGVRAGHRAHPDTASIDRTTLGLDAETERFSLEGVSWRATLRSERRSVRDESARPSLWAHWATLDGSTLLSLTLEAVLELQFDIWNYDISRDAYQDQGRWTGLAGVRAQAIEGPGWSLGLTWESLESDEADETYRQFGLRGGLEHYGATVSGTLTLEVGRRDYEEAMVESDISDVLLDPLFTDFTYTEVWLSGSWQLDERLGFDALASWLPESHSDDEDDQSLGFASLRLVYRF